MQFSDDFSETPTAPAAPLPMRELVYGAYSELDWPAEQHATGELTPVQDDDILVVVVDDDFSDEPTRPDIDVGVSRRKTEPTIAIVDWEACK